MTNKIQIKALVLGIILLFLGCNVLPVVNIVRADISWDVTLIITESGGIESTADPVFGEASDANDGPPADSYDIVLPPPPPMPPYLRAWFNDNLPVPYNLLWKDYRKHTGAQKIWNLSVLWTPSDYATPTVITITWNSSAINNSQYSTIHLCTPAEAFLADMRLESSYTFDCPANIPQQFKIICSIINQPPNIPSNPNPANGTGNVGVNAVLSWVGGDPNPQDTVTYDVYFGTITPSPKVVSNQSVAVYDPPGAMSYATLYYWQIIAWDNHNASSIGPVWSFTTQQQPPEPPGGGGSSPPANTPPVADASAGEPYRGYVNEPITFDGSNSSGVDGSIVSWFWTFGDGANGTGETVIHAYASIGTFSVMLRVTDELGSSSTAGTTAVVTIPNLPPTTPTIAGPSTGEIDIVYYFTMMSTDPEDGLLTYLIDWGDGTSYLTDALASGAGAMVNHTWTSAGVYEITVVVRDEQNASAFASHMMLINVEYVDEFGYLIDHDNDGTYDAFYSNTTQSETRIQLQPDGTYYIDSTNNERWDYIYDPVSKEIIRYPSVDDEGRPDTMPLSVIVGVALVILVCLLLVIWLVMKRKKKK